LLQYGIDLATPQELIAHEKTRQDIARHINADDVIYQDLDDLKAACMAVAPGGKVKDFEVGVFCGKYKTEVPEGYFEHLNEIRGRKRKMAEEAGTQTAVANGGAVNVAKRSLTDGGAGLEIRGQNGVDHEEDKNAGMANPNNRQDIRYVICVSFVHLMKFGYVADIVST
jgi:amidophosphoribosyltransferase